jgi:hypothetical protein
MCDYSGPDFRKTDADGTAHAVANNGNLLCTEPTAQIFHKFCLCPHFVGEIFSMRAAAEAGQIGDEQSSPSKARSIQRISKTPPICSESVNEEKQGFPPGHPRVGKLWRIWVHSDQREGLWWDT